MEQKGIIEDTVLSHQDQGRRIVFDYLDLIRTIPIYHWQQLLHLDAPPPFEEINGEYHSTSVLIALVYFVKMCNNKNW